jgi:hypothetical protein
MLSFSVVYFERVPSPNAIYYESPPNGSVVTHFNVTYVPRQDEAIYLLLTSFVAIPKNMGSTCWRPFASGGMRTR